MSDDEKLSLVNKLKNDTGYCMMDCKKALVDTKYNYDEAKSWLITYMSNSHKIYY